MPSSVYTLFAQAMAGRKQILCETTDIAASYAPSSSDIRADKRKR